MSLALSSAWVPGGADRLVEAAHAARDLGFRAVHAALPPADLTAARGVLDRLDLALAAVATDPVHDAGAVAGAVARAAAAASALRRPLVVLDAGDLATAARETVEVAVDRLCRALHEALSSWPGLALAVRPAGSAGRLVGFREAEWVLDDLAGKPLGLWLDPARALARHRAGAGPGVLDWADRLGRRALGVAVHGLGEGAGHAPPEEPGLDWGTLRDLVPAGAARVLDVGPWVPAAQVVEARRSLEETLGW